MHAPPAIPTSNPHSHTLSNLIRLYEADKHFAASRLLDTLDTHLSQSNLTSHLTALRQILSTPYFIRLRAECAQVHNLRTALQSTTGWIPSYIGESTRVWYRPEEHTASHSVLIEGVIRAPLLNVAALVYEADLYPQLFWYVTSAHTLPSSTNSLLKRAAHVAVCAPWPLYSRDAAIYAYAVDALDEEDGGSVMVVSRSLTTTDGIEAVPKPSNRTVRIDMHHSGFELVPVQPGLVKAKFLYNVDPKLAFIPTALINWGARMLCRWSLRTLESRARDLSKMPREYEERLASSPVYEHIRSRLDQFWSSRDMSPQTVRAREHDASQLRHSNEFNPDATPSGPPVSLIKSLVRGGPAQESQAPSRRTGRFSRLFYGA